MHINFISPVQVCASFNGTLNDEPKLPRGKPANRRVVEQIREARRIAQLASQEALKAEEAAEPALEHRAGFRCLYSPAELDAKLEWAAGLTSDAAAVVKKGLERQQKMGPMRRVAVAPDPTVLESLDHDFPNFSLVTDAIRKRLHLCRLAPEKLLKLPPILLDGPPGVGKSAYCLRLSQLFQIRFEAIDISKGGADFSMIGLDAGYSTGRPGRIWESLSDQSMSVLWMLDEVDKKSDSVKDSGVNYLLGLLEPVTATTFMDNAMQLPINTAWIWYVATCNDKAQMSAPLLSRFQVFDIAAPTPRQVRAIVSSIYQDLRKREEWGRAFTDQLCDDIIDALASFTPREIHKRLHDAHATAASIGRTVLHVSDISTKSESDPWESRHIGFL
jgi:ATP-dependent Lon protease